MRPARVGAVALSVLVLAACGGGDETATATATETAAAAGTTAEVDTAVPEETPAAIAVPIPEKGRPIGPISRGEDVKAVQRALRELGFKPGKADGFYGTRTRKAVLAFQREHGLAPDGLVGPKTARALNEALATAG